jgi:hypothetical protein
MCSHTHTHKTHTHTLAHTHKHKHTLWHLSVVGGVREEDREDGAGCELVRLLLRVAHGLKQTERVGMKWIEERERWCDGVKRTEMEGWGFHLIWTGDRDRVCTHT